MKLVAGWIAVGLAIIPLAASASDSDLPGPGETAFHIAARGKALRKPNRITLNVPIQKSADTAIAARAANQAAINRLKSALTAVGVSQTAIVMKQPSGFGFVGNEALADEEGGGGTVMHVMSPATKRTASSLVEIQLVDSAQVAKATEVLDEQDLAIVGTPRSSLVDDSEAKDAAIKDALANARRDADSYARALGLVVKRIVRVSNDCTIGSDDYRSMFTQWSAFMGGGQEGYMVETQATACIDVLAVAK